MSTLIGWLLIGLAIALFVIGVLASLWRRGEDQPRTGTKIMLILLRLAIGWHFFIEGMDKLNHPDWTSAGYLRESTGPLAPKFRELAGDSVVDLLTITFYDSNKPALSPALDLDWQNYLDALSIYYGLNENQANQVSNALNGLKDSTIQLLLNRKRLVEKPAPYPPPLKIAMTMPDRLKEYTELQKKAALIEKDRLPQYGGEIHEEWKTARANVSKWRADLQKDLVIVNKDMKRTLRRALLDLLLEKMPDETRKKVTEAVARLRKQADTDLHGAYAKIFDKIGAEKTPIRLKKGHTYIIEMDSADIDCYLRLEDATGNKIAEDAAGNRKARITYKVPEEKEAKDKAPDPKGKVPGDDAYRIVASSFNNAVGSFTLLIRDKADEGSKPQDAKDSLQFGKPFSARLTDKDAKDAARSAARPEDWEAIDGIKDKLDVKIGDEFRKALDTLEQKDKSLVSDPLITLIRENLLTRRKKGEPSLDPLPFPVKRPWKQWNMLDWSDHIVKYGILAVGVALLIGLLTRTACVAGAGFLLMFFLAMPPLPGLPESPRAEGHYLYINKNIIEMLALLVLATTYSGRWVGLDGLVQFLCPWCWRREPDRVKM